MREVSLVPWMKWQISLSVAQCKHQATCCIIECEDEADGQGNREGYQPKLYRVRDGQGNREGYQPKLYRAREGQEQTLGDDDNRSRLASKTEPQLGEATFELCEEITKVCKTLV
jgi:hypothetical protein